MTQTTDTKDALDSYITDMLALEDHIKTAVTGQLDELREKSPEYATAAEKAAAVTNTHISVLKGLTTARDIDSGSTVSDAVKRATSIVAGLGAAAIDMVRHEKLSKNLRDDYTAYSLATIGYEMLLTTSLAFGDNDVAAVARAHYADYAKTVMDLSHAIPGAVVQELQQRGFPVQPGATTTMETEIRNAWNNSSQR